MKRRWAMAALMAAVLLGGCDSSGHGDKRGMGDDAFEAHQLCQPSGVAIYDHGAAGGDFEVRCKR